MKLINGNVTKIEGIKAVGKFCGIKKKTKKPDLGIIYSDKVCNTAAVYTQNKVKGAPLYVTKDHLKDGKAQALIINSGIANVCTGKKGLNDAKLMTKLTAKELEIKEKDVLVASTGLIGSFLPMDKIKKGIKGVKKQLSKKSKVATAIKTTDKVKKEICIKEDNFTIGAIAKGSGMIHPNMATMLCFITTDADINPSKLKIMLKKAVNESFNMMTVDMDTSTSDMCILMANGYAGKVNENKFQKALTYVCKDLAKKIAADGEGISKLIDVEVKNSISKEDAKKIAKAIISSNLVKTAIYGNDPNWGRILCTIGNSNANFDEKKVDLFIQGKKIASNGVGIKFSPAKVKNSMKKKVVKILINLKQGKYQAEAFGSDLTEKYVKLNSKYST